MITWALKRFLGRLARRVERSMMDPDRAQAGAFRRLQKELRGSEFALQSGFDRCLALEDCRELPASNDESIRPFCARVFERGSSGVFGRTPIVAIARTSGTLGE